MSRILHTTGVFFVVALFLFGCKNFHHDLIPPDENRITKFEIEGQIGKEVIGNDTISVKVIDETYLKGVPRIVSVSPGATLFPVTKDYMEWMFSNIDPQVAIDRINRSTNLDADLEDMITSDPDFKVPELNIPIDFSDPVKFLVMSGKGTVRKYTCRVSTDGDAVFIITW